MQVVGQELIISRYSTAGTADSFLKTAHLTRHAHQIIACALSMLRHKAYDKYTEALPPEMMPQEISAW